MRSILNVLHALGLTMVVFATTLLFPYVLSRLFQDGAHDSFMTSFMLAAGSGLLLWLLTYPFRRELRSRDGLLLVFLVWTVFPLLASLPLMLEASHLGVKLSFTHAYYEAMSGLTTTGASVLPDVTQLPKSLNLWRHTLVWFGGMGILVLAVAILPMLGVGGHQVMRGEMPGPMKEEKLTPRIAGTAKVLYAIYFSASVLCLIAYRLTGMNWFDAWCHTASTMGLGGFSTYSGGFVDINSPAAEMVAMVFMLFAGINFATHFKVIRNRDLSIYRSCPETIPFLRLVLVSAVLISLYLYFSNEYGSLIEAFRFGMFNTISVATTTGFANVDYLQWPLFLPIVMLFLGACATSSGSTGGGIKMIRLILVIKQIRTEIRHILHPHAVFPVRLGARIIDQGVLMSIMVFMLVYALTLMVLSAVMLLSGLEPTTAFSATFASLNNIGPGLGGVGPMGNYSVLSDFQIWVCTFAMLIGRLELFTVLVIFTPGFWRR
ncbi:TrkH family potassium uptake protein [Advenella sp. RU8]|uniref:TrkH family potassium uptake protein n=1 Tax=Advenella sp. RU8 TaxID=3399575 RepID=UPI003AAE41E7